MSSDEEPIVSARKKTFLVNSDGSDDEDMKTDFNMETVDTVRQSQSKLDHSSLDTDEETNSMENRKTIKKKKRLKRPKTLESSSSESETDTTVKLNSMSEIEKEHEGENPMESDLESGISPKNNNKTKGAWYKNSDLFEAESSEGENYQNNDEKNISDEEDRCNEMSMRRGQDSDEEPALKSNKKLKKPVKELKERKSKKKALEEMKEIHKETQRLTRESLVSIPYHRPKQRTLAEFLERKKSLPVVSLHTSEDQLKNVLEAIEKREKEAELFYKSESSEEENDKENIAENDVDGSCKKDDKAADDSLVNTDITNKSFDKLESNSEHDCLNKDENKSTPGEIMAVQTEDEDETQLEDSQIEPVTKTLSNTNIATFENYDSQDSGIESNTVSDKNTLNQIENCSKLENTDDDFKETEDLTEDLSEPADNLVSDGPSVDKNTNNENFSLKFSESNSENHSSSTIIDNVMETETAEAESEKIPLNSSEDFSLRMSESQCELGSINNSNVIDETRKNSCKDSNTDEEPNSEMETDQKDDDIELLLSKKESDEDTKLKEKYNYEPKQPVVALKISEPCGGVINLDEEVVKPGVNHLMERFYTHLSYKKKPVKKKTQLELSVVSTETDTAGHVTSVNEETVKVLVGEEGEDEDPTLSSKPGAKRARLKATLQAEMGRQREHQWAEKQKEQKLYEEEIFEEDEKDIRDGEKEGYEADIDNDAENNESEEEVCEEEEEEEEEEEDDDEETEEKSQKKRSAFVDDEAEESDDNQCDEEDEEISFIKRPEQKRTILKRTPTTDMFLSQEVLRNHNNTEEEELPSFQKPQPVEDKMEELSEASSVCASPAFPLTGLEGKVNNYNWSAPTTPCKEVAGSKTITPVRVRAQLTMKSPQICSQDLENLCSGEFSSQVADEPEEEAQETEDFKLFFEDSQQTQGATPVKTFPEQEKKPADEKDSMRAMLVDEDDELPAALIPKKVKKLNFSDDEDEGENEREKEADEDDTSDSEQEEAAGVEAEDVAYDSEENEVVKTADDFLDKEAELSESEWGSADEDEQGSDVLEMEEADREKIDQRKLKRDLDQMYMKQAMIEDKEKVRMLQEMLLEDGELHSDSKRERLYRWKFNSAFNEDDNKARLDSDDEKGEEDEDDENWRRSRHEREQFLLKLKKKADDHIELAVEEQSDSELLKLGHKALKRMNSSSSEQTITPPTAPGINPLASPDSKQPFHQLMKRGSFLSRGAQTLTRLAQMTNNASDGAINQPKNSHNFVFKRLSPTKDQEAVQPLQPTNKRKKPELPLPIAKKPCVQKPKMANKKSLFEELIKMKS